MTVKKEGVTGGTVLGQTARGEDLLATVRETEDWEGQGIRPWRYHFVFFAESIQSLPGRESITMVCRRMIKSGAIFEIFKQFLISVQS